MTLHIPRSGAHPVLAFSLIALVLVTGLLAAAYIARGPQAAAPPVVGIASDTTAKRLYDDYSASQAYIRSLDATVAALQADMDALTDAICREGYAVVRVDGELTLKAAPEPRPEVEVQPQANAPVGVEGWRSLVARYFPPGAVDEALLCLHIESRGDPNAVNGDCVGLFQLSSHHGGAERYDPDYNVRTAARLYAASGWSAWPPMRARGY